MRPAHLKAVVVFVLLTFMLASCAPLPPPGTPLTAEDRRAAQNSCMAQYTAVGAAGGALLGAVIGGRHALGGALAGAAVGGTLAFALAWGHCLSMYSNLNSYPMADARQTAQKIRYIPTQGNLTKIESFTINPVDIGPGGTVSLTASYYIMAPEGIGDIAVIETRSLFFLDISDNKWKDLGTVSQEITTAPGTRMANGLFDIPQDAPDGRYAITLKVAALDREDSSTQYLNVRRGR
ncbi:MAG: hypothetical protein HQK56_09370 [Deltaproteobacteria bacterium]|nr:hypothetical protein [Deltaproteobacteria bacterium]